jgi:hypothetical protein
MLGIRLGRDVVTDVNDNVHPETGGLSVAPDDPVRISRRLRPRSFGGEGTDPAWALDAALLPAPLTYRVDSPERHGLIEPARIMKLAEYEAALAATRPLWMRVYVLPLERKPC